MTTAGERSERQDGYYWVKVYKISHWSVAFYSQGRWIYDNDEWRDWEFHLIGPHIDPPEEEI
jgi:hypothetical protein